MLYEVITERSGNHLHRSFRIGTPVPGQDDLQAAETGWKQCRVPARGACYSTEHEAVIAVSSQVQAAHWVMLHSPMPLQVMSQPPHIPVPSTISGTIETRVLIPESFVVAAIARIIAIGPMAIRITSYNVCYTKLLRSGQIRPRGTVRK